MPLPTFNFMQPIMQHDLSNLGNIFGNYYKGYEQARTPQRLAQEELSRSLFNEIQKVDLRYKPQKYESDIGHTNAQTGLTNQQARYYPQKIASEVELNKAKIARQNDPLMRLTGPARDQASREAYLNDPRTTPEAKKRAIEAWKLSDDINRARLDQVNGVNTYRDLSNMPADEKKALYAQYRAVGVPQAEIARLHDQGVTPEAIALWRAQTKRHDEIPTRGDIDAASQYQDASQPPAMQQPMQQPGMVETPASQEAQAPKPIPRQVLPEVVPEYPSTNANITDINQTKGYIAEAEFLHEKVSDYNADYIKTYAGFSPEYYADTILKKNPEKRAKYIAGQIMGQDLALINTRLAGASNAHEAVKGLMERMGANAKIQGWTKNPEDYRRAMEIVSKDLTRAATIRTEAMSGKKTKKKSSEDDPLGILE